MSRKSPPICTHLKDTRFSTADDEDTEDLTAFRGPCSHSTSPYLCRRDYSYVSSFASVVYQTEREEYSPERNHSQLYPSRLQSEAEIQIIKRESEDAKDHLRGLKRSLQAKTEEIRSSSVLSSWEAKARKEYLGRLCVRMESLLEDTRETEEMLARMISAVPNGNGRDWSRRRGNETPASHSKSLYPAASLSSNPIGCTLEGPEKSKQACCSLFRN